MRDGVKSITYSLEKRLVRWGFHNHVAAHWIHSYHVETFWKPWYLIKKQFIAIGPPKNKRELCKWNLKINSHRLKMLHKIIIMHLTSCSTGRFIKAMQFKCVNETLHTEPCEKNFWVYCLIVYWKTHIRFCLQCESSNLCGFKLYDNV